MRVNQMRTKDDTLHMTLLFDFFGDILTKKQREYFDLYHNENLSLSEIADMDGITKQGVDDILSRAESKLLTIESKTGIIGKWLSMRTGLEHAGSIARELLNRCTGDGNTAGLASELADALEELKGQV